MSAQELMKKHYIIQQKVFREKKTIGLSLNLQTLKVRLNPVRRPGSLSTEVDLAGGRLVLSDGRSKAFHLRFVLSTGDWWAIRSITRPVKGDSSAIRPKHGRLVGDSSSHTADQRRFVLSTGDWWAIRPSHGRSKAIHRRFVLSTGDWWAIRSLTLSVKGDSSLNRSLNLKVLTRKLTLAVNFQKTTCHVRKRIAGV